MLKRFKLLKPFLKAVLERLQREDPHYNAARQYPTAHTWQVVDELILIFEQPDFVSKECSADTHPTLSLSLHLMLSLIRAFEKASGRDGEWVLEGGQRQPVSTWAKKVGYIIEKI